MNKDCEARQQSDQMICAKCGLVWDISDPEPPECRHRGQASNGHPSTCSPTIQPYVVQTTLEF